MTDPDEYKATATKAGLGAVIAVHPRYRPVTLAMQAWIGGAALAIGMAASVAVGTWWPLAAAVVVAIAAGIAYGRLAPVQGLQAVLVYQGGLLLADRGGLDRTVRWDDIQATEYTPESYRDERLGAGQTRTTRTYEQGVIWIAGAGGPITLLHVRRMARLVEEIDNRIIPAIQVDLEETLRAEGSVQFDRGRLAVTPAGLVHTPPYGQGGEFAWSQVRSVKASRHGELEIRVTGQPPIRLALLNARATVEFIEELRSAADGGQP
ncbi:hypothetical protein [Streptomyces sparsogenes]|uniref:Uncharacterized protein n=1 Tax=Streptomyces sparsogenes DSM 40356 TaxID=1331668 RepID=A0A1R1SAP6_9ACTN|nr:hypothetical protein [Streptomyces sparsogenes]OMI35320.1 hypothetical protein SPAR_31641 [Streptomyces sparsogenes DSM 40356]